MRFARYLNDRRAIYAVVLAGVVLRIVLLVLLAKYPLSGDALSYHREALRYLSGVFNAPYWPPGLPLYLTAVYAAFGAGEIIGRASMILFYIVLSAVTYWFAKRLFSIRAANIVVLIFTFYPTYVYHSVDPLTQLPAACCLIACAYLTYLLTIRSRPVYVIILGILLGWFVLIRPSSIVLLLFFPFYLLVVKRQILTPVLMIIIPSLIIGAWIVRIETVDGDFVFINYANSYNFFIGNSPYTPLYETWTFASNSAKRPPEFDAINAQVRANPAPLQDSLYRQLTLNYILARPDLFLIRTFSRIRSYFGFATFTGADFSLGLTHSLALGAVIIALDAVFYFAIVISAGVFIVNSLKNHLPSSGLPLVLILGAALAYAAPYFVSFSHPTYNFPIVPLIAVFSGAFFEQWIEHPPQLQIRNLVPALRNNRAVALFIILFFLVQIEWGIAAFSSFTTR